MKRIAKAFLTLLSAGTLLADQGANSPADEVVPTFRSEVRLIKVDAKVTDATGRNIGDLTKDDFRIADEGEPQTISTFAKESDPLDLMLVLDVSGSMYRALSQVSERTRTALAQLHEGDKVGIMLFAQRSELIQPLTTDFEQLPRRIAGSIYKQTLGPSTLLNDALAAAIQVLRAEPPDVRKAILVVTDNQSAFGPTSNKDVLHALYGSGIVMNAVVVGAGKRANPPRFGNQSDGPPDVFRYAEAAGGQAISGAAVGDLFESMISKIRTRYTLHYTPPSAAAGAFRHIRLELSPEARRRYPDGIVHVRDGYYVE